MPSLPPSITCRQLIAQYDTLLFDAYGVLISNHAALPHACQLIEHLHAIKKPYYVVTNGSRHSPTATADRYQELGVPIPCERVITSGSLVEPWIRERGLEAARFMILGPPSCDYMLKSFPQATRVPQTAWEWDALIIGNQDGFALRETVDHVISVLFGYLDRGIRLPMLLPNPDLIYPDTETTYGITGGMVALMIEQALAVRYPYNSPTFEALGKPFAPIFAQAKLQSGNGRAVMIGDQMATDIRGAAAAQIDGVLIGTGLTRIDEPTTYRELQPTYRMRDLSL